MEPGKKIILFDGVCNLCNGLVRFIIKRDRTGSIKFAPLQSAAGKEVLRSAGAGKIDSDTVVYSRNPMTFVKSDAILEIFKDMGGPWRLLHVLRFIPRFIRDAVYDLVARYRYRIFGRKDECMIPDRSVKDRFI